MPVFISLTNGFPKDHLFRTIRRTSIYVFVVCVLSFFIGEFILNFFGVSIHALKIAGGIIISRSGFQLLNAQHKSDVHGPIEDESRLKEVESNHEKTLEEARSSQSSVVKDLVSKEIQKGAEKLKSMKSIFEKKILVTIYSLQHTLKRETPKALNTILTSKDIKRTWLIAIHNSNKFKDNTMDNPQCENLNSL